MLKIIPLIYCFFLSKSINLHVFNFLKTYFESLKKFSFLLSNKKKNFEKFCLKKFLVKNQNFFLKCSQRRMYSEFKKKILKILFFDGAEQLGLIKLFHFEIHIILLLFKSSTLTCEYHLNKYTNRRKSDTNMHVFPCSI